MAARLAALLAHRRAPWLLFALYMAPRVLVLLLRPLAQSSDFLWYFDHAATLAATGCYCEAGRPIAFLPVGWPAVLAGLFRLFGPAPLVGQLANLGFAAATFWLTLALGTRLAGAPAGRLAVLLLAVYPNAIGYVPLLATEPLFTALLLAAVLLLHRRSPLAAGLALGAASLVKTQALLLPALLLGFALWRCPSRQGLLRQLRRGAVLGLAMLAVAGPWAWRNHRLFDTWQLSRNGGWTLLTGNNPEADGDYTPGTRLAAGVPADHDRAARDRALRWIAENPGKFLILLPQKLARLWLPDGEAEWFYQSAPGRGYAGYDAHWLAFRALRAANQLWYGLLLLLALPELLAVLRRQRPPGWESGLAICVHITLISLIFSGQSRFHAPAMPFIALYAAATLLRRAGPSRESLRSPSAAP